MAGVQSRHQRRTARPQTVVPQYACVQRSPSPRHAVNRRRLDQLLSVTAEVALRDIIAEDEDDVGFLRRIGGVEHGQRIQQQGGEGKKS